MHWEPQPMPSRQKSTSRDRLDGARKFNLISEFYLFPGRMWLWLNFMNPKGGYAAVRASTRHARSPVMTWIYSVMFWVIVLPIFLSLFIPGVGIPLFRFGIALTGAAIATLNIYTFVISGVLFGLYSLKSSGVI